MFLLDVPSLAKLATYSVRYVSKNNTNRINSTKNKNHTYISSKKIISSIKKILFIFSLPPRLQYMRVALASQEEDLKTNDVTLGILGMPRSKFDTILQPIMDSEEAGGTRSSMFVLL